MGSDTKAGGIGKLVYAVEDEDLLEVDGDLEEGFLDFWHT
jgi:hypothetical protein